MNKVLYLSYTAGMLEPLGQSQVLNYLSCPIMKNPMILISYEKKIGCANKEDLRVIKERCSRNNIEWRYFPFHDSKKKLAKLKGLIRLFFISLKYSFRNEVKLIHCRSYITAIIGGICSYFTRKPFLFDMRALWVDELVISNRISRSGIAYKVLMRVELLLLKRAAKVVSLTNAAVDHLLIKYPYLDKNKFIVIPTCVDVTKFSLVRDLNIKERKKEMQFNVGLMGTVLSPWFCFDESINFYKAIKKVNKNASLHIITRDDRDILIEKLKRLGVNEQDVKIMAVNPSEVSCKLDDIHLGVMFFRPDISKIGSMPTRLGEFLAKGVPVISNNGVGDLANLIKDNKVGCVVSDISDNRELEKTANKIYGDYEEIVLSNSCRILAENYFSTQIGAKKYQTIYDEIIN